jgi:hypothetical protein
MWMRYYTFYISIVQNCSWIRIAIFSTIGTIRDSLTYTSCGKYLLYPLGSFVVIKNIRSGKESFFDGHTREVSCLSVSKDGLRMASGQMNIPGVKVHRYVDICVY